MDIKKLRREFGYSAFRFFEKFLYIYLLWAFFYGIYVLFTEATIRDLLHHSLNGIKSGFIFFLTASLISAILFVLIEQWFFPYVTEAGNLYRKHVCGYYLWRKTIANLDTCAVMVYISVVYGSLNDFGPIICLFSIIVVFCTGLVWVINAISLLLLFNVLDRWLNADINKEKKVCTYITATEATSDVSVSEINDILKHFDGVKEISGTRKLLWEGPNVLICPHWLYKEYLRRGHEDRRYKLFILKNGSFKGQEQERETVIDEYLSKGIPVAEYIIDIALSKLDKDLDTDYEKVAGYAINRYFEKNNQQNELMQFLIGQENCREIPYFNNKIYRYPYSVRQVVKMKYKYVDEELAALVQVQDATECFYRLLKLIEYIWHYRALAMIAHEGEGQELWQKGGFQSSLGLWEKKQNQIKHNYTENQTVKAYCLIKEMLQGKKCSNTSISYPELCEVLTQLRNRYVGHGTMAFSVSQELLDALKQLAGVILEIFYNPKDVILEENARLCDQVPLSYFQGMDEDMTLCLLAGWSNKDYKIQEYLNYQKAQFCSVADIEYRLDYREDV